MTLALGPAGVVSCIAMSAFTILISLLWLMLYSNNLQFTGSQVLPSPYFWYTLDSNFIFVKTRSLIWHAQSLSLACDIQSKHLKGDVQGCLFFHQCIYLLNIASNPLYIRPEAPKLYSAPSALGGQLLGMIRLQPRQCTLWPAATQFSFIKVLGGV